MKLLRISKRHQNMLAAGLIHRLEFWRQKLEDARADDDMGSVRTAADHLSDYADLLNVIADAPEMQAPALVCDTSPILAFSHSNDTERNGETLG